VLLTIICPVQNEEGNIVNFFKEISRELNCIEELDWQILFSDNDSTDQTKKEITQLMNLNHNINYLKLSKNFGYQGSIKAGLSEVKSDLYMIVDVDCQDPPELIKTFYKEINEGYDVVFGRRQYLSENLLMRNLRKFFYLLLKKVSDSEIEIGMAEFAMFTKQVRDAVLINKSTLPFLRAEIAQVGFKRLGINYSRESRKIGKTHYRLKDSIKYGFAGILNSSTYFLRLTPLLSFFMFLVSLFVLLYPVNPMFDRALEILIYNMILIYLSVIAIYLARVFHNTNLRPLFVIDRMNSKLRLKEGE
jgi:dolichol-phosphate mannosyltransferase